MGLVSDGMVLQAKVLLRRGAEDGNFRIVQVGGEGCGVDLPQA